MNVWFLLVSILGPLSFGSWTLVEDFESFEAGVLDPSPWPMARNPGPGKVEMFSGTPGGGDDGAACFWGRRYSDFWKNDTWYQLALPE